MDLEPSLKRTARILAESFHRFAQERRWPEDSYRIQMMVKPAWGIFRIRLTAEALGQGDQFEEYKEIMEFLRRDLPDPQLAQHVFLSLGPRSGEFLGSAWPSETEIVEVDEGLLNPGLRDLPARP